MACNNILTFCCVFHILKAFGCFDFVEFSVFFKSMFSTGYAQYNVCRRVIGLFVQQWNLRCVWFMIRARRLNLEETAISSTCVRLIARPVVHAIHADKVFAESGVKGRIIIKSPDTDVLVLCVHYFSKLQHTQELWFQTGTVSSTKDRRRYIPVHEICSTLSPVFTNILPAAHAVTGCDTTSLLFGIGKRSVFKVLKEDPDNFKHLSNLAEEHVA
jgi:hypothetical protein